MADEGPNAIAALYDNYDDAVRTVHDLEAAGVPPEDMSIVSNRGDRAHQGRFRDTSNTRAVEHTGSGAATGASIGTVLGGGAGLLAGLGLLAIPGIGPVVAAGWFAATVVGAAVGATAGGIIGALTGAGLSEWDAQVYAEGVRRGGTLVIARAAPGRAALLRGVMAGNNAVDIGERRERYQVEGWERFDPLADPLTPTESRRHGPAARP